MDLLLAEFDHIPTGALRREGLPAKKPSVPLEIQVAEVPPPCLLMLRHNERVLKREATGETLKGDPIFFVVKRGSQPLTDRVELTELVSSLDDLDMIYYGMAERVCTKVLTHFMSRGAQNCSLTRCGARTPAPDAERPLSDSQRISTLREKLFKAVEEEEKAGRRPHPAPEDCAPLRQQMLLVSPKPEVDDAAPKPKAKPTPKTAKATGAKPKGLRQMTLFGDVL